jgi:hypothetical protein
LHLLSTHELLRAWETGQDGHPLDRAFVLLQTAWPEQTWEELAALCVGDRDARLLSLREQTLGPRLDGFAECPHCGEGLEFDVMVDDLRTAPGAGSDGEFVVGDLTLTFRLPDSRDLGAAAACHDAADARRVLVERCVLHASRDGVPVPANDLSAETVGVLAERMAEQDPQAEVLLALQCPACDRAWQAHFDIASFLWSEVAAWAHRLLDEVHTLARAYGWSEADILGMSVRRRQTYLGMLV